MTYCEGCGAPLHGRDLAAELCRACLLELGIDENTAVRGGLWAEHERRGRAKRRGRLEEPDAPGRAEPRRRD